MRHKYLKLNRICTYNMAAKPSSLLVNSLDFNFFRGACQTLLFSANFPKEKQPTRLNYNECFSFKGLGVKCTRKKCR